MTLRELQKTINIMVKKNKKYLNKTLYLQAEVHSGTIFIDSISFPPVQLEDAQTDCNGQASIVLRDK